jgi:putative flippase GtrA
MPASKQVACFALVSGIGWAIDFSVFAMLTTQGLSPFTANVLGAGLAVTWVFFTSVRRIFGDRDHFLLGKFAMYALWQVAGISVASLAISLLHQDAGMTALWAKILVTPATFLANFAVMSWLTTPRRTMYA